MLFLSGSATKSATLAIGPCAMQWHRNVKLRHALRNSHREAPSSVLKKKTGQNVLACEADKAGAHTFCVTAACAEKPRNANIASLPFLISFTYGGKRG